MNVEVVPRIDLRAARPTDAAAIRRLEGLSPASGRLLDEDLRRDDRRCLVAEVAASDVEVAAVDGGAGASDGEAGASDGEVLGYAALLVQPDAGHILDVVVAPRHRGRGIAGRLLDELARAAEEQGVTELTLEVAEDNVPARALYRRLGFVAEGRRPRYYPDGSDALILWRRAAAIPVDREDR